LLLTSWRPNWPLLFLPQAQTLPSLDSARL